MCFSVVAQICGGSDGVIGYHTRKDLWDATIGKQPPCQSEHNNAQDAFAVDVLKDGAIFGQVSRKIFTAYSCFDGGWLVPKLGTRSKLLGNRFKLWTDMNWTAHANLYRWISPFHRAQTEPREDRERWISPFHRAQTEPREDRERWISLLKFRSTALTAYFWTVNHRSNCARREINAKN